MEGTLQCDQKISDVTYRIQNLKARKDRQVVHFNMLKPCPKDTRLENRRTASNTASPTQLMEKSSASNIELVVEDDAIFSTVHPTKTCGDTQPTLSTFQRNPPHRYGEVVYY